VILRALHFFRRLLSGQRGCGCDSCVLAGPTASRKLVLFGSPNVGKSVIFNQLTGSYAVVSNYPGTTVEVVRGRARIGDVLLEVVDSPGTYSLTPLSQDESVARDLLLDDPPDLLVHVIDAKNLRRMLPLTFQLIEAGLPIVLDVNIIDEATRAGMQVDLAALARRLGLPVVATAAAVGLGVDRLRALISDSLPPVSAFSAEYPAPIESAVERITAALRGEYKLSARSLALQLLQREAGLWERVLQADPDAIPEIEQAVADAEAQYSQPLAFSIAVARQKAADRLASEVVVARPRPVRPPFTEVLGRLAMHPLTGIPLLIAVLYVGLYLIVGRLGAGIVVDFLDVHLFGEKINPAITTWVERLLPYPTWSSLFVGEFGVITLGLRYAIAIVLPLVGTFFLTFAVLEDSGYLPRLALLVDRLLKRIGLSGRAVIPLVLGLGCGTMATLVTRVLETRRERLIATFLLALAIPCSAQLGVILGLLSIHPLGLAIWAGVLTMVFLLSGFLAARLLPGEAARFYVEVPPLRLPSLRNVAVKTFSRLRWYAAEVIPLFLLASLLIWLGQLTRIFDLVLSLFRPLVSAIGLPPAAADAFLFGFFRRDYGAARLFDVHEAGGVSGVPLVVAMVTITLFIPCIAQFLVMQKERGLRTALAVSGFILPFAFGVGALLNLILTTLEVKI
jgi:ferrous iron transport protein B